MPFTHNLVLAHFGGELVSAILSQQPASHFAVQLAATQKDLDALLLPELITV